MPSIRRLLGGLLFLGLLSGCTVPAPEFSQLVLNRNPASLCVGGMRALSGFASAKADSGLVAFGTVGHSQLITPPGTPVGTPITFEARCFGQNHEEIAYLHVTRAFNPYRAISFSLSAPQRGKSWEGECTTPGPEDVQRGPLICLSLPL